MLVLAAAFAAACSSSEDMIGNEFTGGERGPAPFSILGTSGSGVVNTDASYGEYTAFINVPGKWSVATSKGLTNIYPSSGEGPTMAVVQVGENWGALRENVLTLTTQEGVTRAAGDYSYSMSIVQSGNPALDSVSAVFSSCKGAGYSYMPGGEYCDGALIQLFNLVTLDSIQRATGVRLISDDILPQTSQEYLTANGEEALKKALTVNASLGVNFGDVKDKGSGSGSIGVDVEKNNEKKSKNKFALKRQKNTQFTREIHYMNVMALLEKASTREEKRKLLSPGFLSVQESFAKEIAAAKGNTAKQYDICDKFLGETGPCFISKSVMGTVLDYQISVDSTALRDTLDISVALEASFQTKVENKDAGGEGSAGITITKDITEMLKKTTATIRVHGGDVSQVCILVSGGKLNDSDVTAWQNSCRPALAAMVDMVLVPIYGLIADAYAREVLKDYFSVKLKN
jgi:hypothetical protein